MFAFSNSHEHYSALSNSTKKCISKIGKRRLVYATSVEEIRKRADKFFNVMKFTITERHFPHSHTSLTGYAFLLSPITSVFNNITGFAAQNGTDKTHEISFNNKLTKSPNSSC